MLIVDDSVVIRKIVGKYFDSIRLPYVSCEDGLEAATWLKRQLHSCAAIITDLEMPKMGGDALIALAMMLDPKLPCFVLSGNDITSVNLPRGARRAIVKPVSNSDLHSVLREVLSLQAAAILSGDIQNYCKDVAISLTDNV